MSFPSVFHVILSPSAVYFSSPLTFLMSFSVLLSVSFPETSPEFFSQLDTVISSVLPAASAFTYTVSSLYNLSSLSFLSELAAYTGIAPTITDIPTAREVVSPRLINLLFLFMLLTSFLPYFASAAYTSFPTIFLSSRKPMDVLQITLSKIINIAGSTKSTTIILMIAPRANNVQIDPIISTFE